jgi:predicted transposase YdaD
MVVLLHRTADGPDMSGVLHLDSPDGRCRLEFHYHVVRVWELDLEKLLAGGIGTLPLAPLAAPSEGDMPRIVNAMMQRVDPAATSADAREFWATTAMLAGLRFPWESIKYWFRGVTTMQESSVYQGLLQEGRAEEARKIVLRLAERRFGAPDKESQTKLESMSVVEQLEQLAERIYDVSSWIELLAAP